MEPTYEHSKFRMEYCKIRFEGHLDVCFTEYIVLLDGTTFTLRRFDYTIPNGDYTHFENPLLAPFKEGATVLWEVHRQASNR